MNNYSILECLRYVCAEEIFAKEPFPPFRASIKDGYAVHLYSDQSHEQIYEVAGRSDAGGENVCKTERTPNSSIYVFTNNNIVSVSR